MDISTVLLLQKTSYIAGATALLFLRRTLPNTEGVVAIAACFMLLSVGSTIAAYLDPQRWDYGFLAWMTLVMGVVAYSLWTMGLLHLSRRKSQMSLWHVAAITVIVMVPVTLAGYHLNNGYRASLFTGFACISQIASAGVIWRDHAAEPLKVRPLLAGLMVATGILLGVASSEFLTSQLWLITPASLFFLLIISKFLFVFLLTIMIGERQHSELRRLADTDGLTGVANRRAFNQSASPRLKAGDVVLLIDVDKFKSINDRFGHACGDDALKSIAETLRHLTPQTGLVARYGGEEFCVYLPGKTGDAYQLAERIRSAIERRQLQSERGELIQVTVSIGLAATFEGENDLQSAFSRADTALYRAKHAGRNRVVPYEDDWMSPRMRSAG